MTAGFATAASDRLTLAKAGFSIAALEGTQALAMLLSPSDGFAANVNVQVQPYPGTLDDYIALSRDQFREIGATVVSQRKSGASTRVVEYTGEVSGSSLHFYSRAEKRGNKVYLATASATAQQRPSLSAKLKACVDSLKTAK